MRRETKLQNDLRNALASMLWVGDLLSTDDRNVTSLLWRRIWHAGRLKEERDSREDINRLVNHLRSADATEAEKALLFARGIELYVALDGDNPDSVLRAERLLEEYFPLPDEWYPREGTLHFLIEVASYVGAAAAGGVIGNRVDALTVAVAREIFRTVCKRWYDRTASTRESDDSEQTPLTQSEATDAAKAAASILGYDVRALVHQTALPHADGGWVVVLRAPDGYSLRARVPAGNPAKATILLIKYQEG